MTVTITSALCSQYIVRGNPGSELVSPPSENEFASYYRSRMPIDITTLAQSVTSSLESLSTSISQAAHPSLSMVPPERRLIGLRLALISVEVQCLRLHLQLECSRLHRHPLPATSFILHVQEGPCPSMSFALSRRFIARRYPWTNQIIFLFLCTYKNEASSPNGSGLQPSSA